MGWYIDTKIIEEKANSAKIKKERMRQWVLDINKLNVDFGKVKEKKNVGVVDNNNIFLVDGNHVKINNDMDFVEGGNDARYKFIPEKEIWVDSNEDRSQWPYIILHERVERNLMVGGEMKYDDAHNIADEVEKIARENKIFGEV